MKNVSLANPGGGGNRAFTLVELLVVIAIIGILIALLLPAVQAAREAARRMQCSNNMKQLALACHVYADAHKAFPLGSDVFGMGGRTPDGSGDTNGWFRSMSGWVMILPFIEQAPLYELFSENYSRKDASGNAVSRRVWDFDAAIRRSPASFMACPSDGRSNMLNGDHRSGSYMMSAGDYCTKTEAHAWGGNDGANYSRGAFQPMMWTSLGDISDGTSNTVCCSERLVGEGGTLIKRSIARTVSAALSSTNHNVGYGAYTFVPQECLNLRGANGSYKGVTDFQAEGGRRWYDGQTIMVWFNTILPPNAPSCSSGGGHNDPAIVPPTSNHTGGVNISICDGSVRFVSDTVGTGNMSGQPLAANPSNTGKCVRGGGSTNFGVWGAIGSRNGSESETLP